jgi:O-6-methylguanine DNA methyltransferase
MGDDLRALLFEVGPAGETALAAWGWVGLVASSRGLRYLGLPALGQPAALQRLRRFYRQATITGSDDFLQDVADQLQGYLTGRREQFEVELDLRGHTAFELAVWAVTARIPYGATRTYGWLAGQVGGGPGTAQAVGAALGNNPVPLIVPCHRVIGSDGSLHGFAGGLEMKARLLALENHQMAFQLTLD